jgi:hypothetical protein
MSKAVLIRDDINDNSIEPETWKIFTEERRDHILHFSGAAERPLHNLQTPIVDDYSSSDDDQDILYQCLKNNNLR